MSSNITLKEGIYDPTKRYAFTNVTDEDFTFYWDKKPIVVKAKETVELKQYLAILATTQLTDKIMLKTAQDDTDRLRREKNDHMAVSPLTSRVGIPAMREPIENSILKELPPEAGNDASLQIKRMEMLNQLQTDMGKTAAPPISKTSDLGVTAKAFEDINLPKK